MSPSARRSKEVALGEAQELSDGADGPPIPKCQTEDTLHPIILASCGSVFRLVSFIPISKIYKNLNSTKEESG